MTLVIPYELVLVNFLVSVELGGGVRYDHR